MHPPPVPSEASSARRPATTRLELIAIGGLPDFQPGDDLPAAILACCERQDVAIACGDIVVIAQKVVSKCEGAYVDLATVVPGNEALELAAVTGKDPRLVQVVLSETSEVLRATAGLLIVANKAGHVMANAGVDVSNLPDPGSARVLKLPADADASALAIRRALEDATGRRLAVVINDSWGRAWRNGTTGHAVGVSGMPAVWNRRGEPDMYGRELRTTEIGLADEVAAAASLLMGAAWERQPVVIVRGVAVPGAEGSARDLVREKSRDLFR